jgi:hypothetical protein
LPVCAGSSFFITAKRFRAFGVREFFVERSADVSVMNFSFLCRFSVFMLRPTAFEENNSAMQPAMHYE